MSFFCFWAALCDRTFEEGRVINRAPANFNLWEEEEWRSL